MDNGRITSGIAGLDIILNGGFLPGSIYLVEGVPGAGKTTLGLQFIHSGVRDHNQAGLIITFEEFPEQIERDALSFGWDLRALQADGQLSILNTSPDALKRMMEEPGGPIDQLSGSVSLKRVLVDSVTHFQSMSGDARDLRKIVFGFVNGLRRLGVTALLTKEIERDDPGAIPFEEYLVDGVIRLSNASECGLRRTRSLEVLKSRGHPHLAGRSGFRFGTSGVEVFPRLSPNWAANARWLPESEGALREESRQNDRVSTLAAAAIPPGATGAGEAPIVRVSTGVAGVDAMLSGGMARGSSALIAGTSGTGKTILCLHFLHAGLSGGEPAVILTMDENVEKLVQFAASVNLNLEPYLQSGLLQVECSSPGDVTAGEAFWRLYRRVRSHNATRVVIDSLNALFGDVRGEGSLMQTATQNLLHLFGTMQITTLMSWEIRDITGDLRISDHGLSALVDSLLLLRYVETGSEVRRVIGIIKARGADHDHHLREFRITPAGFKVEDRLVGFSGILRGSARELPKRAIEELLQPLVFIQDIAGMLERKQIPADQVTKTLQGLAQEAERLIAVVQEQMSDRPGNQEDSQWNQ